MHYSFSPRDPISLQGLLSFSGHSQQPAHTNFLPIPTNRTQPCGPSTWTKNPPGNMPEKGEKAANQRSCKGTWTCLPRKPRGTKHKICINFTTKSSSTFQQYPSLKWCFPQGGPWQNNLPRKAQDNTRGCCNESKSWDAGGDLQRLG